MEGRITYRASGWHGPLEISRGGLSALMLPLSHRTEASLGLPTPCAPLVDQLTLGAYITCLVKLCSGHARLPRLLVCQAEELRRRIARLRFPRTPASIFLSTFKASSMIRWLHTRRNWPAELGAWLVLAHVPSAGRRLVTFRMSSRAGVGTLPRAPFSLH